MKRFWIYLLPFFIALPTAADSVTPELLPGDSIDTVYAVLGEPRGTIGSERFLILHFARGEVHVREGVVERVDLISEEELEARAARAREAALAREAQRQERLSEGRALRDERLTDPSFKERSAREQMAFWNTFQRHYPEVDISFELEVLRAELAEEERLRRLEQQRQIELLALQQRVREAEIRATEIERENRRLEEEQRMLRERPRITHVSPVYIINPHTGKPPEKEDPSPPPTTPQTRPQQREVRGAPPADPTPFERAREYRLERGNIRSEARLPSS